MKPCPTCLQAKLQRFRWLRRVESLSPRQQEVLVGIADSKTCGEIADSLHISPKTVEWHRGNLVSRLGLPGYDSASLTRIAMRAGLVTCLVLLCAATLPVPKLVTRPQRKSARLVVQSPKGAETFTLAGAVLPKPRSVPLAWDYSFTNNPGVVNFIGYYWTNSAASNSVTWGKVLSGTVSNLLARATYWFGVRAEDTNGTLSDLSNVVTDHPTNLVLTLVYGGTNLLCAYSVRGPWWLTNRTVLNLTNPVGKFFVRGLGTTNRIAVSTLRY